MGSEMCIRDSIYNTQDLKKYRLDTDARRKRTHADRCRKETKNMRRGRKKTRLPQRCCRSPRSSESTLASSLRGQYPASQCSLQRRRVRCRRLESALAVGRRTKGERHRKDQKYARNFPLLVTTTWDGADTKREDEKKGYSTLVLVL